MEIIKPKECTVLVLDSVSLQECSDKIPNDELIARGSVKIKKFRKKGMRTNAKSLKKKKKRFPITVVKKLLKLKGIGNEVFGK